MTWVASEENLREATHVRRLICGSPSSPHAAQTAAQAGAVLVIPAEVSVPRRAAAEIIADRRVVATMVDRVAVEIAGAGAEASRTRLDADAKSATRQSTPSLVLPRETRFFLTQLSLDYLSTPLC